MALNSWTWPPGELLDEYFESGAKNPIVLYPQ
jgi:hypothetical protein